MGESDKPAGGIHANISGGVSGQVAVGGHNVQNQTIGATPAAAVTADERAELKRLLAELAQRVAAEAPAESKDAAAGKVTELEEALAGDEPDLTTMEYVRNWFGRHVPVLAGVVASVVVHPIVGKLVAAAGDTVAAEFRRRFSD